MNNGNLRFQKVLWLSLDDLLNMSLSRELSLHSCQKLDLKAGPQDSLCQLRDSFLYRSFFCVSHRLYFWLTMSDML